jgi:hypothetical protein
MIQMTQSEFRRQIQETADLVDQWPEWVQKILTNSARPMVSVPRPVATVRPSSDSEEISKVTAEINLTK